MERPSVVGIAYFEVPHNSALRHMLGKVPSDYYTKKIRQRVITRVLCVGNTRHVWLQDI
jgi:hypothetical protein